MGEVEPHPVLVTQALEHRDDASALLVQFRLAPGARNGAPAEHERVHVGGHTQLSESRMAVGIERQTPEVVVVEVAVGHAHRLAAASLHGLQRPGVVTWAEQADLTAYELRVLPGAANCAHESHLAGHLGHRVPAVGTYPLSLLGVIAGCAGEVATWEHPMRPLTADGAAPEELGVRAHVPGQL